MADEPIRSQANDSVIEAAVEVLRVALPLMISTGTLSLVLFADRTLLLWHDGASMSASMAGGNLFWVLVCLPVGVASMTGAIVSQYVGAGEEDRIGRFLWQSVWSSLMVIPLFALFAKIAPWMLQATGQPESLVPLEATYLRLLMFGAVGIVMETGLSGFFSGTERTSVIMWVSIASGLLNVVLDVLLIFGAGPIPALGIAGAALGSVAAFWFKTVCYACLLLRKRYESTYQIRSGRVIDGALLGKLLFYGFPTGLMFLTESAGFTMILLRIGRLGDIPLRATTMAINFNLVAYIPLVGVSIATSVLVGRHLLESGPSRAARSVYGAIAIGLVYSGLWSAAYLLVPDWMMSLYELNDSEGSKEAILIAGRLLAFVAVYVVLDATQLIVAGALRGAGDTWFVLICGFATSATTVAIGLIWEPVEDSITWWWWMITMWIWILATAMMVRFAGGRWKKMKMV